jgi:hypothetical protein
MAKLSKNQRKREIIATDVKQSKQSTLEDLSFQFNIERAKEMNGGAVAYVKTLL